MQEETYDIYHIDSVAGSGYSWCGVSADRVCVLGVTVPALVSLKDHICTCSWNYPYYTNAYYAFLLLYNPLCTC